MKKVVVASIALVVLLAVWGLLFVSFKSSEQVLFPGGTYQVYAVTDSSVGGFSTADLSVLDSSIAVRVNIRSGVAYPHAGMGVNLLSVHNRPAAGFFDFSAYDSLTIDAETGRMRKIAVKILNNDPIYSKNGVLESYRPMVASANVQKEGVRLSLLDFKVPDWWLAMQGLDEDDGLRYMGRGVLFEILNGEGTMLGIPDDIVVRSIKLWGENRTFKVLMYVALVVMLLAYAGIVALAVRNSKTQVASRQKKADSLKNRMEQAAGYLEKSDRSVAEIAAMLGLKNAGALEKEFVRVYGVKPLEYRKAKSGK